MENQFKFIWQLIEETPMLKQKLYKLDTNNHLNDDEQVGVYIDFFQEVELIIEEVASSFRIPAPEPKTRIFLWIFLNLAAINILFSNVG